MPRFSPSQLFPCGSVSPVLPVALIFQKKQTTQGFFDAKFAHFKMLAQIFKNSVQTEQGKSADGT